MSIDPLRIASLIREVAATHILPRYRTLKDHEVFEKAPGEMVTVADREAEVALARGIAGYEPAADIVGEEAVASDPDLMHHVGESDRLWLIDPVDGTRNFINGSPDFAVMVARLDKGQATDAWIYRPVSDEMAIAEAGAGTWLNGERLQVGPPPGLTDIVGAAHIRRFPQDTRKRLASGLKAIRKNSPLYCAGLDYLALCQNAKNFSLYNRTLPWDHVPGALLYRESGGYVKRLDGSDYEPAAAYPGLMSAPNETSWHTIRHLLLGY